MHAMNCDLSKIPTKEQIIEKLTAYHNFMKPRFSDSSDLNFQGLGQAIENIKRLELSDIHRKEIAVEMMFLPVPVMIGSKYILLEQHHEFMQ
jgi:hypothetical protein